MAYKKYIKRDGKLYGPYIYQSKRIGDKVVSEYCGQEKSSKKIFFILTGIGILFIALFAFLFFNSNAKITGDAVLNKGLPSQTEKASESLSVSLKEGELLPASSKVIFEINQVEYEYALSDLISDEKITGDYYIQGKTISGSGEGYGLEGSKLIYPKISFGLISRKITESDGNPIEETPEASVETDAKAEPNEESAEADVEEKPAEETPASEEVAPIVPVETPPIREPEETPENSDGGIFAFFLGLLKTTGFATSTFDYITGETSAGEPFIYSLKNGESIELSSGSIKFNSEKLDDNLIKISNEEGKAIVKTEYSLSEKGFGKDYIGEEEKILNIRIPDEMPKGEFNVKIKYGEEDLIVLGEEIKEIEKEEEIIKENETKVKNETSLNEIQPTALILTDNEKSILSAEFGNYVIETKNSELFNGRYLIAYKLDDYEIEYSYDAELSNETLNAQMEKDRIKWLKDITDKLSSSESSSEEAEQFMGNFSI